MALLLAYGASPWIAWAVPSAQRYDDFSTKTPIGEGEVLVIGFQGGRERWNTETTAIGRLAARIRVMNLPGVHVETVENRNRHLAIRLVRDAFDRNGDGDVDPKGARPVRVVLFGHSFGGAAVVKLARELDRFSIPVMLTVQVDSVGRDDGRIPPNVSRAANFFQRSGRFIRGEPAIVAEDPARTSIVANIEYDYDERHIDISKVPWFKKVFRRAHAKMELDPEVWAEVERLIVSAIGGEAAGVPASPSVGDWDQK